MKPFIYRGKLFENDNKAGMIFPLIVMVVATVFFAVCLVNCIKSYLEFDISYDDLSYEELTFDKYNIINLRKSNDIYEIYFKEYSAPFYISGIVLKELDKDSLAGLKQGERTKVYYCQSSHRDYDHSICEMSCNSEVILSLQGYVEANQNNQVVGMIVCPILFVGGLLVVLFIVLWLCDNGLGKLKLEYKTSDNVIQVYKSMKICSLVINGKVVDRYFKGSGRNFCLKGNIKSEGKRIPVKVCMKNIKIQLYFDGDPVVTGFMLNPRYW